MQPQFIKSKNVFYYPVIFEYCNFLVFFGLAYTIYVKPQFGGIFTAPGARPRASYHFYRSI